MSLGDQIARNLPYLRRYARALTGSQATGDAFVRATLEAALADSELKQSLEGGRVPLYRAFNKVWSSAYMDVPQTAGADEHEGAAQDRLKSVTPLNRQALLLTTLEDFSPEQAAEIMDISAEDIERLAQEAVSEIDRESATSVLIIEDEPLISMQLEDLVTSLGHEVCGTAATRTQAQEVVAEKTPGLVLADEPTGSLDQSSSGRLSELLLELVGESGTSLVVVTHAPTLAARLDRSLELRDRTLAPLGPALSDESDS